MDDLVKRLRSVPPCNGCGEYPGGDIAQIMDIAADRIAALEAQVRAADALADLLDEAVYILGQHRVTAPVVVEGRQAVTAHRVAKKGGA